MTWTVYGIRLKGEREVRYIGFTGDHLAVRLKAHLSTPIMAASYRPLLPWIRENRDNVELFAIAKCETEYEARVTESVLIALCLRLDHRLLNGSQVPPHLKARSSSRPRRPAAELPLATAGHSANRAQAT